MATTTPAALLAGAKVSLNSTQRANAQIILEEFTLAGIPTKIALAAVANAYSESALDHLAVAGYVPLQTPADAQPTGENSVGLFQLNAATGAAGAGMSVEERKDPRLNTRRIIEVVKSVYSQLSVAPNAREAAALFCRYVERPRDSAAAEPRRMENTTAIFPAYALSTSLPSIAVSSQTPSPYVASAGGGGSGGGSAGGGDDAGVDPLWILGAAALVLGGGAIWFAVR